MNPARKLEGLTFGRLRVLGRAPSSRQGAAMWHCECACGKRTIVRGGNLTMRKTESCGCYRVDVQASSRVQPSTSDQLQDQLHEDRSQVLKEKS